MKKIKILGILLIVLFVSMMGFCTQSFAAHDTQGKWLGLYEKGNGRKSGFYLTSNGSSKIPVIKIVEYTDGNGAAIDTSKENQALYCLKDGIGFGSTGSVGGPVVNYSEYFNLKNTDEINSANEKYRNALPSGETYNKLIWLLDNICIPEDVESVNTLLEKAEATALTEKVQDAQQLKDILEVVQQAAIWYFTNADDEFKPLESGQFHRAETNGGPDTPLSDIYSFDMEEDPVENLFKYLIQQADANGQYNFAQTSSSSPITFDKTRATVTLKDANFLIGPYKFTENGEYASFTANIYNGQSPIADVTLQEEDGTAIEGSDMVTKIKNSFGKDFYIKLPSTTSVTEIKIQGSYTVESTKLEYWSTPLAQVESSQPVVLVKKETDTINFDDSKIIEKPNFDLALRKFITEHNGTPVTTRIPSITQEYLRALATRSDTALDNGTTAKKTHTKDPLSVNTGDKVVYTIRVYNEGEIDGYAQEITDYLPEGLELVPADQSEINTLYGWVADETDSKIIRTDYLSKEKNPTDNLIKAFNKNPGEDEEYTLDFKDVKVECVVVATTKSTDTHLKNVAEITDDFNEGNIPDRDSVKNNLTDDEKGNYAPGTSTQGKGYQDDDDYEDLKLPGRYFDVALRKFITSVNGIELKTDGVYDREPKVDVSPLLNGQKTASYQHVKTPVSVSAGDIVTYTIRVYNEGQVDGYVDEIVDHLPPELEFLPEDELNRKFLWTIDPQDRTQRTIKTSYLSSEHDQDNLLTGFDETKTTLDYKEVQIRCKVAQTAPTLKKITNIAEITASSNEAKLTDRDNEKSVVLPQDSDLPNYKGKDSNKDDLSDKTYYYEGQEDDDDFEKIILEKFDLALRKFITGVNDQAVTSRVPQVDTSKYGTIVDGKEVTDMTYNHPKDPVRVAQNDVVIYTIRIFNEGTKSGYVAEIKDDIPDGLEFILNHEINEKYRWVLYDEDGNVTTNVKEAKTIRTDYLSKDNEETDGEFLLKAFDPETMDTPDFKDVQVAFKVTEPNTSDRIITNHAEISKDTDKNGDEVDDIDSTPDEWIDEDDDQDVEHLYVKYFDLALRKWVSQAILIEDGVQKEMDTHHYAEQDPEPAVKVELNKARIENTIVKFRYQIRITNEGEIEGYATEISDYIPEGLKFNQADNPKWREENGKIITDQLKDTLLQPGESVTIDVVLTWINSEENLNLKTNVAEISEDYNESGTADIDSTPNNRKEGEDDIDDAPVILTVVTGQAPKYIAIITGIVLIIGVSVVAIKKYVI